MLIVVALLGMICLCNVASAQMPPPGYQTYETDTANRLTATAQAHQTLEAQIVALHQQYNYWYNRERHVMSEIDQQNYAAWLVMAASHITDAEGYRDAMHAELVQAGTNYQSALTSKPNFTLAIFYLGLSNTDMDEADDEKDDGWIEVATVGSCFTGCDYLYPGSG